MSRENPVRLMSRTLGLLLIVWALVEITYLPLRIFAFHHHIVQQSMMTPQDYSTQYYSVEIISSAVRIVALLLASAWLWKSGHQVESLLWPKSNLPESQLPDSVD